MPRVLTLALTILGPSFLTVCSAGDPPLAHSADWRIGGVCYEVFVRSFFDSDGDGIGDLKGLIQKLDYISDGDPETTRDLGAQCIWLMPIHPSPSYHGYDVSDFYGVDPELGTADDFRALIREAHDRGVAVLLDLVFNHTSSEHPWFQEALRDPDSPYRDWYQFRDRPGPPNEWGDSNWHLSPLRDEYYYGFFWHEMPDLNWNTTGVREEFERIAEFWLKEMGVDGFRLDAVRHLMEVDGQAANVPIIHEVLRDLIRRIRKIDPDAFTIGEVFDSTDVLLAYYPDQLDYYFAFEVADGILAAARTGSAEDLLASVDRLQREVPDQRWAPFLRNHDQPRTVTLLGGDWRRARLAATLLLTLPGMPFVYYGEEIGMTGDKPDPRIRSPMHWSLAPAAGFTEGEPWEPLEPDSFTANVEAMDGVDGSLLNHYRRLIHLRGRDPALAAGDFIPLESGATQVAAFLRRREDEVVLVVANLGEEAVPTPSLSSLPVVLPTGEYSMEILLGKGAPSTLEVMEDGRIRSDLPLPTLPPLEAFLFRFEMGR